MEPRRAKTGGGKGAKLCVSGALRDAPDQHAQGMIIFHYSRCVTCRIIPYMFYLRSRCEAGITMGFHMLRSGLSSVIMMWESEGICPSVVVLVPPEACTATCASEEPGSRERWKCESCISRARLPGPVSDSTGRSTKPPKAQARTSDGLKLTPAAHRVY
jgi:hypothetical protein